MQACNMYLGVVLFPCFQKIGRKVHLNGKYLLIYELGFISLLVCWHQIQVKTMCHLLQSIVGVILCPGFHSLSPEIVRITYMSKLSMYKIRYTYFKVVAFGVFSSKTKNAFRSNLILQDSISNSKYQFPYVVSIFFFHFGN